MYKRQLQANAVGDHAAQFQDLLPGRPVGTGDLERELFLVQGGTLQAGVTERRHEFSEPPQFISNPSHIFLIFFPIISAGTINQQATGFQSRPYIR